MSNNDISSGEVASMISALAEDIGVLSNRISELENAQNRGGSSSGGRDEVAQRYRHEELLAFEAANPGGLTNKAEGHRPDPPEGYSYVTSAWVYDVRGRDSSDMAVDDKTGLKGFWVLSEFQGEQRWKLVDIMGVPMRMFNPLREAAYEKLGQAV